MHRLASRTEGYYRKGHDLAEIGLIVGLVATVLATVTISMESEIMSLWPQIAELLNL